MPRHRSPKMEQEVRRLRAKVRVPVTRSARDKCCRWLVSKRVVRSGRVEVDVAVLGWPLWWFRPLGGTR